MSGEKRDFDALAAAWDEDPRRVQLASLVADAIGRLAPLGAGDRVLDVGCGTGLLTLLLQPGVGHITGVDNSAGMLTKLREKAARFGHANVTAREVNVDSPAAELGGPYQAVVSSMTLHHVADVPALLGRLHGALAPDGRLAIADLDPDDGLFHPDNTGVRHFGFEREALAEQFTAAGFAEVRYDTVVTFPKTLPDGSNRTFSVFLMAGRKEQS